MPIRKFRNSQSEIQKGGMKFANCILHIAIALELLDLCKIGLI